MAQIAARVCNICEESEGKYVCYECSHFLCECCKWLHAKFPANRHHTVTDSVSIDLQTFSFNHKCEQHSLEFLHFCSTCSCLTCNECVTSEHNSHVYRSVGDVAADARETIKEKIINVKDKISRLTQLVEEIKFTTMLQIPKDYEQFTHDVTQLSHALKNIVQVVSDVNTNHASDFLALETAHWNQNLATVEKLLQEHTFICTKLENIMTESHNVTFFINCSELLKEVEASEDFPVFEETNRLHGLNVKEFIVKVVEMMKSQYDISYLSEESTQYENELTKLTDQIRNDKERYQKETEDLHVTLTSQQSEIDELKAKNINKGRLYKMEIGELKDKIKNDEVRYQEETEQLQATLTRKQDEMDEFNSKFRETRINEMEQTIEELQFELLKHLGTTDADLETQQLNEKKEIKETFTQANKLYRCRFCKGEKVQPKGM
ncbi:repetitive organellar protein-like [Mytilus californianus]|uniref:repetitive organellar protein-like n=1 Tax=Mytilus californianus TaxID=6549 RepID=UPI0022482D3E|nr:repetitive organellar protein-like [Mytilus californianus]